MANTIILKKSSTASSVPAVGDLQPGELAVNLADQKLYSKTTGGTVILVGSGLGGSGTVTSVAALTLGTTGTDLSSTVATGTTTPVITLQVPTASASNRGALSAADWSTFNNKGSGTVTSVTGTSPVVSSGGATPAISLASGYGDTQNPYASKTANHVLAAPNGTAGVPTFRAIVAADIPTLNQNTSGSAASLSATLAIASGGTAQTAFTANYIHYGSFSTSANLTYNGTDFVCGGNVTAYSDERVKTNWRDLPSDFIDQLVNVKHGIFDRTDNGITQVGVGAQSLAKVLTEAVIADENDKLSVAYGNAALVAVIELSKRVLQLENLFKEYVKHNH